MTTTTVDTDFIHVFEPGSAPARKPLLLLHGTGGDERDLLSLGRTVAPGASLLSPRGKVLEGAAPRFFRRLAEGVFDEEDLRRRTDELADFVLHARERHGLPAPIALGFSNGANIAAALLLQRPEILAGAALLREYAGADEEKKKIITEIFRRLAVDVKDELVKAAGASVRRAGESILATGQAIADLRK